MFEIRDYQQVDIANIRASLASNRSIMYQLATGGGKTVTAGFMVSRAAENGRIVWFLCHRKELVEQSSKTFEAMGISHGIIAAGRAYNHLKSVQVGMIQTISRRLKSLQPPDMILFDEGHHVAASSWSRIFEAYPNALKIGLSATPERLDGKGLDMFFKDLVQGKDTGTLIQEGRLSPYKMYAPSVIDTSSIGIRAGDFKREELEDLLNERSIVGDVINSYCNLAAGKKAILFAATVKHSRKMVEMFNSSGITAAHVDGTTPKAERSAMIEGFRSGEYNILSNVDLFGEGFDVPDTEAVLMCRPTQSLGIYLQQCGRGLRPVYADYTPTDTIDERHTSIAAGRKPHAVLIDHAGNCFRHGLPCDKREWSLAGRSKKKRNDEGSVAIKSCPECFSIVVAATTKCECGYVWQSVSKDREHVEGNLKEVTADQIKALKKESRREQGRARTMEDLVSLGRQRGYKNPHRWAAYVMHGRNR